MSNWPNQKIGGATLGCILTKLPKVGGAIAVPRSTAPACSRQKYPKAFCFLVSTLSYRVSREEWPLKSSCTYENLDLIIKT